MSGLPTCSSKPNHPRGMCIGQAEPLNEGHLCVISDTSGCLDDQQETSESRMNCSLMSPELSDEQRNKLSELLGVPGFFTKTDKSTAAKTNKMLDEGIVQPSESPWSSPVVLVRKKTVVGVLRRLSQVE
ncbi:retrovirus-related Pol polyprotein from transposon 297 [Trichonephila clavipes]|nr:retrovirus-related Pol polyprotein from transposon 297 [Trichonephila clavipes]